MPGTGPGRGAFWRTRHARSKLPAQTFWCCVRIPCTRWPAIEAAVAIPLFHIADPTAAEIKRHEFKKVGLLGTRFTMEQDFYRDRFSRLHGIEVLIPIESDRAIVHRIIYDELCMGQVLDTSRNEYRRIIGRLIDQGAQAVILGCTEIAMLVGPADSSVPVFDTASLHARNAAELAMSTAV
jgi:aspartate racemase